MTAHDLVPFRTTLGSSGDDARRIDLAFSYDDTLLQIPVPLTVRSHRRISGRLGRGLPCTDGAVDGLRTSGYQAQLHPLGGTSAFTVCQVGDFAGHR